MRLIAPSAKSYYRRDLASRLTYFGLIAMLLGQYVTTVVPAYAALTIALLLRVGVKMPSRVILYICAVALYWLAVLSYATGKNVFTHMLFYFGFQFFYVRSGTPSPV